MKQIVFLAVIFFCSWIVFIAEAHQRYQQEKTFNLQLNLKQVETVVEGLKKLPYEQSAELISSIIRQAQFQARDTVPVRPKIDSSANKKKK